MSSFLKPSKILKEVHKATFSRVEATTKVTIVLSFLAGAYIAIGGLLSVTVGGGVPGIALENPGLQKFLMGAFFPIGLILCVVAGADLFTGNTAYFMPPLFSKKIGFKELIRNWTLVYAGNFIGSVFVAYFLAYHTGIFAQEPWLSSLTAIAEEKTTASFFTVFIKGVGANWLVALAVWTAFAAKDIPGKVIAIWFPVMAFVTMGFEHSVANMFFIPAAIFYGADVTWGSFLMDNLIPATLGNIVGGSLLTGMLYWYVYDRKG